MESNGHNTRKRYIEKLENEKLKISPIDEIHFTNDPNCSEEDAIKWIEELSEFERLLEIAPRIPLREFLGSPIVRPLADIQPADIDLELDRVLDILAEHNICIEFMYLDDASEAYRFIVEELFDELIENVPMFMTCHYIYEDFHPNDVEDAKMWAENFLRDFFLNDLDMINVDTSNDPTEDCMIDGISVAELQSLMEKMHEINSSYTMISSRPVSSIVEGDRAVVEMTVSWKIESSDLVESKPAFALAILYLKRCIYGGWDVTHLKFPDVLNQAGKAI